MKKPTILKKIATALAMTAICCSTLVPTMAKAEIQPRGCTGHDWHEQNVKYEYTQLSSHQYTEDGFNSNGEPIQQIKTCSVTKETKTYDRICYNCWKLEIGFTSEKVIHSSCGQ